MNYKNARPAHARWLIVLAVSTVASPNTSNAQNAAQERLEEIIVTSSIIAVPRRQLGTPISAIDNAEIELRGYTDLADVLRTQPGIGVSNSGGTGKQTTLRVRGEEGYRTLLMIDGVKALDASAPQVAPSFDSVLATNDLKRVEILRGPQGFIYGADAGGVVNVLTATGEGAFGGRLGLEYGDLATRKLTGSVSSGGERGDYFVSATDLQTDGFNAQTADTLLADEDGAENTTLHVKLGWNAAENLRLQLVARDIDAESMDDGCFSPTTFATVHDCVSATEQTTYKVSADYGGGAVTHAFGLSNVTIVRENRNQGVNAFATDGEIGRFEYTGSYRSSDALTLVYGLDLQREEIVGGERLERDQRGYYAEYQGAFGSNFFLSLGARYDDNEDFGTHTSSRLSAAYVQSLGADGSLKYRASFGTGFRPPSLYELSYNSGPFAFPPAAGLALIEESSRGYDIGVEYLGGAGLNFEVTYFDQKIEDEIFFDLTAFSGYLQSPGESASKGLEIALRVPLGEHWDLLGNWTHNDTADTNNEQRLRRPETSANIGFLYNALSDRLRLAANYRLARDAIDIGGVALDDYEVLDLSLAYAFNETLELSARVQNATDEDYQEVIGYRTAGRAAYAGVRLRF